ncbi:MAG: serine/threonine-protein kinase, partial [Planctomyces sp.]
MGTGKPPGHGATSAKQNSEAQKANLLPTPSRQEQSQARSISEFLTLLQSLIRHADQHNVSLSTELRAIVNRLKEQHQAGTLKPAAAVQILSGSNTASLNVFERSDSPVSDQSASDQPVSIDEGSLDRTIIAEPKSPASEFFMANVQSQRLGRYELVEKIGEGSAGIVYRAIDVLEDRTVAVKVLNPAGVSGPSSLIRFEKEARLLSRINHPCIAAHLDFNNDRGVSYLVVEYLPGGTLSGHVTGLSICSEKEIVRLILDAVRGLAAAHEQGIVHRDIKPENLLLTETGHRLMTRLKDRSDSSFSITDQTAELQSDDTTPLLKLSDFGLARFEQQTESLAITRDGAILGTPLYMSPEQCRGEVAGPASDVYSLGATLFHLIAGRPPFEGTT